MKAFSQIETEFIRDNWQQLNDKELSEKLGRSEKGIRQLRTRNDWFRKTGRPRTRVYKEIISPAYSIIHHRFIEDNYRTMTDLELAKSLNRTQAAISAYRFRYGFKGDKQLTQLEKIQRNKQL